MKTTQLFPPDRPPPTRYERSAKGHPRLHHGKPTYVWVTLRLHPWCIVPGESPRALRQRVPARKGRSPGRPPHLRRATPGQLAKATVMCASGDATHQLNGAYSRADARTPPPSSQQPYRPPTDTSVCRLWLDGAASTRTWLVACWDPFPNAAFATRRLRVGFLSLSVKRKRGRKVESIS